MLTDLPFSQRQFLAEKIQEQVAYGATVSDPGDFADRLQDWMEVQEVLQLLELIMDVDSLQEFIDEALETLEEPADR